MGYTKNKVFVSLLGNVEMAEFLIKNGININATDREKATALHIVADNRALDVTSKCDVKSNFDESFPLADNSN